MAGFDPNGSGNRPPHHTRLPIVSEATLLALAHDYNREPTPAEAATMRPGQTVWGLHLESVRDRTAQHNPRLVELLEAFVTPFPDDERMAIYTVVAATLAVLERQAKTGDYVSEPPSDSGAYILPVVSEEVLAILAVDRYELQTRLLRAQQTTETENPVLAEFIGSHVNVRAQTLRHHDYDQAMFLGIAYVLAALDFQAELDQADRQT